MELNTTEAFPINDERLHNLVTILCEKGLDLVHPFSVSDYNSKVNGTAKLKTWGPVPNLGLLIGNTRNLWPAFLDYLKKNKDGLLKVSPLDDYVEFHVRNALHKTGIPSETRWDFSTGNNLIPLQALAELTGFATRSVSYLSIHRQYGPWISLRAAVSLDFPLPIDYRPPSVISNQPCTMDCSTKCLNSFEAAKEASEVRHPDAIRDHWKLWVNVRDICSIGKEYRFSDEQIYYHYTKDKAFLYARVLNNQTRGDIKCGL